MIDILKALAVGFGLTFGIFAIGVIFVLVSSSLAARYGDGAIVWSSLVLVSLIVSMFAYYTGRRAP